MTNHNQDPQQAPGWGAPGQQQGQFTQAPPGHQPFQPPVHQGFPATAPGGPQYAPVGGPQYAPVGAPPAHATHPGHPVHPEQEQPAVPAAAKATRKKGKGAAKSPQKKGRAAKAATPAAQVPAALEQIPKPGSRYAGGRGKHVGTKATVTIALSVLSLVGATALGAYGYKAIQRPPVLEISEADQAKFGLDTFPVTGAAAFAERYVRTCLATSTDDTLRRTITNAMSTDGVPDDCGWPRGGPVADVVSSTFTGILGPVPGYETTARFIGVQAILSDSRTINVVVPVWTSEDAPGAVFMVVGPLGNNPLPAAVEVEQVQVPEEDTTLGSALQESVFNEFFGAWGSSNTSVLDRFATKDASLAVRSGLAGSLGVPTVSRVTVRVPDEAVMPYEWAEGDVAVAEVAVSWAAEAGAMGVTFVYRVSLVSTADGWSVSDIAGGGVDVRGANVAPEAPVLEPEAPAEG